MGFGGSVENVLGLLLVRVVGGRGGGGGGGGIRANAGLGLGCLGVPGAVQIGMRER